MKKKNPVKDQSAANGWKDSGKRKDKKKVPSESESSDTDSDSEEKGSEADMKEIMAMFSRSFRKGKFNQKEIQQEFPQQR